MVESETLMAHLVPKLTRQVEDTATDALAYILNRSERAREVLNDLISDSGFEIFPIVRVETQVTHEDGSRPDMAGYDIHGVKRLIVESKFWAALQRGQTNGYLEQLEQPGPAVLLFIAPEARVETLWSEVERRIRAEAPRIELTGVRSSASRHIAQISGTDRRVMLVGWVRLLERMASATSGDAVEGDIRQLLGLALRQDTEAFLPIHLEELSPDLARRVVGYNKLVDDVVDARGVPERWLVTLVGRTRLRATPQRYGYGRYFRFRRNPDGDFWLGVNFEEWARWSDTPLWLRVPDGFRDKVGPIGRCLNAKVHDTWVPIHPRLGVEYEAVLEDMADQLKRVARVVEVEN